MARQARRKRTKATLIVDSDFESCDLVLARPNQEATSELMLGVNAFNQCALQKVFPLTRILGRPRALPLPLLWRGVRNIPLWRCSTGSYTDQLSRCNILPSLDGFFARGPGQIGER